MTRQAYEIQVPVPPLANTSTRASRFALAREKAEQQDEVRRQLDLMAHRPRLPCRVTLGRVGATLLDSDGHVMALKYIRDTVARWIHGLEETVPALNKDGRPVIDDKGQLKMTRPPAPDGPRDGITWAYAPQQVSRRRAPLIDARGRPRLTKTGRQRMRAVEAVRIILEELEAPEAKAAE